MKILLCHNYYQQPGGEDECFVQEARLLESYGHDVVRFTRHNDAIRDMSRAEIARKTLWNRDSYAELRALVHRERPAIVHFTNTFPLISPSGYYAARDEGAAVVQSLHNYRLLCPGAFFLRESKVCEKCLGRTVAWPAVWHGCYRESRGASAVLAAMLAFHRAKKTWHNAVDAYCALTEFGRQKFIQGGLPAEKIAVKPNFLEPDPQPGSGSGGYALFVGRLSKEKGIDTLLSAWSKLKMPVPLQIVGDGPMAGHVESTVADMPHVRYLGRRNAEDVLSLLGDAACLVVPSYWYEGFPRTILEAFAKGTPVVGSRLGAMTELIQHGCNGVHVQPGDAQDLALAVERLFSRPQQLMAMRPAARSTYADNYTAASNYRAMISVYDLAIRNQQLQQVRQDEDYVQLPTERIAT